MAGIRFNRNMFTVGMISQKLQGNTESETYNNSLLECKNFYIRQTGGVFKRPGTVYVDTVVDAQRMKLFPFNISNNKSIIVGITPGKIFAYDRAGQIDSTNADSLTGEVINDKSFNVLQDNDNLYIFSSVGMNKVRYNTETRKLSFASQDFTFEPVSRVFNSPNMSATFNGTNTVTLVGATFTNSDIGDRCLLIFPEKADSPVNNKRVLGYLYAYFKISSVAPSGASATVTFESGYSSFDQVSDIPTTATQNFALPAFGSVNRGYPLASGIYDGRLFLADKDLVISGSSLSFGDLFDFALGGEETSGISYRFGNNVETINWIIGGDKLFVGTPTGIYISGGSGVYQDEKITPFNMTLKKFSSIHAGTLKPIQINSSIFFTDVLSKNLYEISVDEAVGTYKTYDLSLLSNELLNSGIVSHTWSNYPVKTYWCACEDGTLASMTYEKGNNVMAWSYHELGGRDVAVESVASIVIDGYDYVFCVVRRNVDGEIVRSVEYIDKLFEPLDGKDYQQHYVDSGVVQNYTYEITEITQYVPPSISGITDVEYDTILQNEASNQEYMEMCLLASTGNSARFGVYTDNVWRVYQTAGLYTNHVSFCYLGHEKKTISRDGKDRSCYVEEVIDNNSFLADNTNVHLGFYNGQLEEIVHDEAFGYLYKINASTVNVGDIIVFRDTGLKSTNNISLDSTDDNYVRFNVTSVSPNGYFGYVVLQSVGGYTPDITTLDMEKERKAFRAETHYYSLKRGANAKVTQKLESALIAALNTTANSGTRPQGGVATGILWNSSAYFTAFGKSIYNNGANFDEWSIVATAPSEIKALIGISDNQYMYATSATFYLYDNQQINFGGAFQRYIGRESTGSEPVHYFVVGGKAVTIMETNPVKYELDGHNNITSGVVYKASNNQYKVQWYGTGGEYLTWTGGEATSTGTIQGESRTIRAAIVHNSKVYIVGDAGLFYRRPENDESDWTSIDSGYIADWAGILEYDSKLLLWSKTGELLLVDTLQNTYTTQELVLSGEIVAGFVQNGVLFFSCNDGRILRSMSAYNYTLTFFDLSTIYIDDVVGMEGINKDKYVTRNFDTTRQNAGYLTYEIWNEGAPVDTRAMGVYDQTVTENGTAHLYFRKVMGLKHLAGQVVNVCLDGNFLEEAVVSNAGTIEFRENVFGMEAHVGYKYEGVLDLMPLSGGNMRGSSVGSVGSQKSAFARLYYSLGGKYGTETDNMFKISYPTSLLRSRYNTTKMLYSGVIELPIVNPKDYRERKFRMEHSEPVSFNVLSIAQDAEISDA